MAIFLNPVLKITYLRQKTIDFLSLSWGLVNLPWYMIHDMWGDRDEGADVQTCEMRLRLQWSVIKRKCCGEIDEVRSPCEWIDGGDLLSAYWPGSDAAQRPSPASPPSPRTSPPREQAAECICQKNVSMTKNIYITRKTNIFTRKNMTEKYCTTRYAPATAHGHSKPYGWRAG